MFVIVPDSLRENINHQLTQLYATLPEDQRAIAEKDREIHYQQAIEYFAETGNVPVFGGIEKNGG